MISTNSTSQGMIIYQTDDSAVKVDVQTDAKTV